MNVLIISDQVVKAVDIPDQYINHFIKGLFDGDGYLNDI